MNYASDPRKVYSSYSRFMVHWQSIRNFSEYTFINLLPEPSYGDRLEIIDDIVRNSKVAFCCKAILEGSVDSDEFFELTDEKSIELSKSSTLDELLDELGWIESYCDDQLYLRYLAPFGIFDKYDIAMPASANKLLNGAELNDWLKGVENQNNHQHIFYALSYYVIAMLSVFTLDLINQIQNTKESTCEKVVSNSSIC